MRACTYCSTRIDSAQPIGYATLCPSCSEPLHSCVNCRFYSPGSYHDCAERVEEFISDKKKANYCDFFMMGSNKQSKKASDEARKKAEALFSF